MMQFNDICPICSVEVQKVRTELRGSRKDKSGKRIGDIRILESWCPSCEIYLTRKIIGRESDSGWKTSFVQENTLKRSINSDTLEKILQSIEIDLYREEKLEKFLSMMTAQDEIYEYVLRDEEYTIKGLTIKREKNLIGDFRYSVEIDLA